LSNLRVEAADQNICTFCIMMNKIKIKGQNQQDNLFEFLLFTFELHSSVQVCITKTALYPFFSRGTKLLLICNKRLFVFSVTLTLQSQHPTQTNVILIVKKARQK
jgi:hypothetical protein